MGAIFDVIVDLRPESHVQTWAGVELNSGNRRRSTFPKGLRMGTNACDNTEIYYQTSQFYAPESARGNDTTIRPSHRVASPVECISDSEDPGPITRIDE